MKTLTIFAVSFSILFATMNLLAQTAAPAAAGATEPAAPAAQTDNTAAANTGEAVSVDANTSNAAAESGDAAADDNRSPEQIVEDETLDAEDVVRRLLGSSRKQTVIPETNSPKPVTDSSAVAPAEIVKPLPEPPGAMLVNRMGRLLRNPSGEGWKFHFESDGEILYEPPLSVLPNRVLEAMENILEKAGQQSVLFKITGEITNYRGQRFVLIRRMIVRRETGAM